MLIEELAVFAYMFLVYWIIPCYPKYRNCFRISLKHLLASLLAAICTLTIAILFFFDRGFGFIFAAPLVAVISYVDMRDMEIPQLPMSVLIFFGFLDHSANLFLTIVMAVVLTIFVVMGKLGFGDVELAGFWTSLLGLRAMVGMCIACVLCIIVSMIKKEPSDAKIPFGPYICAGMAVMICLPA